MDGELRGEGLRGGELEGFLLPHLPQDCLS
jgi:hypothetical protein